MSSVLALEFILVTGNYLLFWPVYRLFHPKKTERRSAFLNLFLVELASYTSLTGLLVLAVYKIPDFHHGGFWLAGFVYLVVGVGFWLATLLVWADTNPEPEV
jgi:hypothetical protein